MDVKDVELFQNRSVHEFYRLKALITLEQVNTLVKTSMVGAINWSDVVRFNCMQMSLL